MNKLKFARLLLNLVFFAGLLSKSYGQLIGSGISEDPVRYSSTPSAQEEAYSKHSTFKTASSSYTDTLRLPFFEDFTGHVISIDSIVGTTLDNLLRLYDPSLSTFVNGTPIFIGFQAPIPNTLEKKLSDKVWYLQQLSPGVFSIDSSSGLTTPMEVVTNTLIRNAYWRRFVNTTAEVLDTLKWVAGGNTYINNRFPLKPVSYNVATFDGLRANGVPYNTVDVLAKGYSDQLTSLPINLATLSPVDNVYFSFYWQHSGIGEAPETEDFIELQFKNNTGTWNTIADINGNVTAMDTFNYALIQLTDAAYFFNNFQFRFRSYGRLSGPFDLWHIDYIYLNSNRTQLDSRTLDFSIGNTSVSFLKNYTALPYGQYFANKTNEIGNLQFTTNNLDRDLNTNQIMQGECLLSTEVIETSYSYLFRDVATGHPTANAILTYEDECLLALDSLQNQNFPMKVDIKYSILGSNDTVNVFNAYNNTTKTSTILWDYYAYDDGSPEWGIGANLIGAKIGHQFTTTIKDTLTEIDMFFTRSKGPNMAGRTILVSVWDENFTLITRQPGQVQYGGFIRYKLAQPFIVEAGKTFYVGYQQNFVDLLSIGYDRNYDHSNAIFFNTNGSDWNQYSLQPGYKKGSMMIRPVFNKNQSLITSVNLETETKEEFGIVLFPNPCDDYLTLKGLVSEALLYDFTGKTIASYTFDAGQDEHVLETYSLPAGLYLLDTFYKGNRKAYKVIVRH